MSLKETIKFIIVGIIATIISLFGFQYTLKYFDNYFAATLIRWFILIPVLYIGYSRFVLIETLRLNRKSHGILKAEGYMISQVALAVGASFLIKLILEPLITKQLIQRIGTSNAIISPILADFVYGPIVNYYVLLKINIYNKKQIEKQNSKGLLRNPSDSLSTSMINRMIIWVSGKSADLFKFWKYPKKNDGCFENMTLVDKLYWIYKANKPISNAEKNTNIEEYFRENNQLKITLPEEFQEIEEITFCGVGDLMQNDLLINSKDTLYKGIGDLIFTSDISFGNLESPLTTLAKQEFIFSDKEAPPTYISQEQFNVLKGSEGRKFTIMSTACNHACDYGFEGVNTTIEKLKDDDIIPVGTNLNSGNQEKATIIKVKDITVGVIAFTFGLNGKKIPEGKDYCVNRTNLNEVHGEVDLSLVKKQIEDCKTKRCDVILLSLHWGLEYEFYPTQRQMEVAHLLVEEGVDLIISHHPHVIQPVEYYQTKRDANRKAVICYSLGNLINPFSDLHLSVSLIMRMAFVKGIIGGETRTYINNCELYPIFQRVDVSNELPQVYLEKLSEISLEGEQKEKVNKIVSILGDKIYSNHDLTDKVKSYY